MRYALVNNSWGEEEHRAVIQVLEDKRITMGDKVAEFEARFASTIGSKYAVMVNSGSSANLLAISSLFYHSERRLKVGDEAIVPAMGWSTTYSPLHQHGLKMKIVDVEMDSLNMDVSKLEDALTEKTRLLVGVNILGNPASLDEIRSFADEHDLWFIEDNCESMGASLNGYQCGTWGDIGTFSMFFSHHLNTGEGGILVTNEKSLYETLLMLRAHGWDRALKLDGGFYNFVLPGYNVRPTEITAAVGLVQLDKLSHDIKTRRENAALFNKFFGDDPRFRIQVENGKSSWFSFTMIPENRTPYLSKMREAGIEHRAICGGCVTEHPVAKYYDYSTVGDLPNARKAHYQGFFVGNSGINLAPELNHLKETL